MANYETRVRLISETNVNVANNTSYVTIALDFRRTDYQYYGYNLDGDAYWLIKVDSLSTGNVNFTFNWTIPQNQWKEVARRSFTVTHNADGTKSINLSGTIYFGAGVSPGTLTASGKAALSTIPRATTPSLSPASQAIGSAVTINLPRASSAFTHTLTYSFGSASGTIATGAGASASWTLPSSLAAQIPNTTSGTGQITCNTYNGSTLVGTKYINFTATVPASMVPSIGSIGITEASAGINAQFGAFVQNKSRLNIAISASGIQGSSIVSYKTEVDGASFSGSSVVTGYITSAGSLSVKATVTDSRGRTAVKTQTVNVVAYANPAIAAFTAVRATTAGVFDDQGTSLSIAINFNVSAVGNKNTKNYAVDLQKNGETAWVSVLKGSVYAYNSTYIADNVLSVDSSYTLRLRVTDYFTTSEAIVDVSSGFTLMDFRSTGKGIAIGKVSEKDIFEIGMDADFRKGISLGGKNLFNCVYPVGSIYMSVNSTNPSILFGGTWVAWGSGCVPVGIKVNDNNFNTVEKTGGVAVNNLSHTHTVNSHAHTTSGHILSTTEIPAHTHSVSLNVSRTDSEVAGYGLGKTSSFLNRVLVNGSAGNKLTINSAGGNSSHSHGNTGSSAPGTDAQLGSVSNLQPYITCYMWKRTA
mgnify:CR=1 FL=1